MVATAFKVNLSVRNSAGQFKSIPLAASDVNAAALTYPSAGTEVALSSLPCVITDVIATGAGGTDTSSISVYINGTDTGYRIFGSANLPTTVQRQVAQSPISVPAGALVKFIQNT